MLQASSVRQPVNANSGTRSFRNEVGALMQGPHGIISYVQRWSSGDFKKQQATSLATEENAMANQPQPPRDDDDFVSKVVKDPANPPDALLLSGYKGDSPEAGHTRLYLNPELNDYVDIPDDAILHTAQMPPEQGALRGIYIWIKRDAEVVHAPVLVAKRRATFLEGRMQRAFAGQTQADTAAGVAQNAFVTGPSVCVAHCASIVYLACQNTWGPGGILCRNTFVIQLCHSVIQIHCPPVITHHCPSQILIHCPPLNTVQRTCLAIICNGQVEQPPFTPQPTPFAQPYNVQAGFAPGTYRPDCMFSSQVPQQCPTNAPVVCPTVNARCPGGTQMCW
jgi:hypothetical protein